MRLGYFTMPVHPLHRNWAETLKEDREAIILADSLGFYDAFMGEHLTDQAENITNSMMFNATLIHDTKKIKLATGTSNLSQMHPNWLVGTLPVTARNGTESKKAFASAIGRFAEPGPHEVKVAQGWPETR